MQVPAAVLSGNTCEKSVNKTGGKYPEDTGEIFAAAVYALLRAQQKPPFMKTAGDQQRFEKKGEWVRIRKKEDVRRIRGAVPHGFPAASSYSGRRTE